MAREANFGGDFSRRDARRSLAGEVMAPDGGLRALASHESQEHVGLADVAGAASGHALQVVAQVPDDALCDAGSGGKQASALARVYRGAANNDLLLSLQHSSPNEVWTVVDSYERDGQRFLVARRDERRLRGPAALSPRERQALDIAVLGDSNKYIAFEMGISASTVGVLLHRAARKLGSRTRRELLARFRELAAHPAA